MTVRATDSADHTIERELVIDVADVNETPDEPPEAAFRRTPPSAQSWPLRTSAIPTRAKPLVTNCSTTRAADSLLTARATLSADGSGLNHEAADSHEVTVRATDSAGNTIERTVVIEVTDVNESPVELAFSGGNVPENAAPGTVVATAAVTDVDAGDSHTGGRRCRRPVTIDADGNITVAEEPTSTTRPRLRTP